MAFIAACKSELIIPNSFQSIMDDYFNLDNVPSIKHPTPNARVINAYANQTPLQTPGTSVQPQQPLEASIISESNLELIDAVQPRASSPISHLDMCSISLSVSDLSTPSKPSKALEAFQKALSQKALSPVPQPSR